MKKASRAEIQDDLRPEYDLKELLKGGVRGKYVERYRAGAATFRTVRERRGRGPNVLR